MKRSIITIDEEKCNGCGLCVPDCPEGALQIIDGKARLVSDLFCDGLGACIKTCPQDAMTIEEREAEPYNERRVMANIVKHGANVIKAHLQHLHEHGEAGLLNEAVAYLKEEGIVVPDYKEDEGNHDQGCGCQGSQVIDMRDKDAANKEDSELETIGSELRQWPVQLKLLNPNAPYFKHADLLITADCVPTAYGDFHRKFIKDRIVIMFCPKLDPYIDEYIDKLAAILSHQDIRSITVARMEVPCCGGSTVILNRAMEKADMKVPVQEIVVSIRGDIIHENRMSAARAL